MERHEILTDKIDWPNLVRHVVRDRVVVELAEGELPVAMLVPIERPKTMADLDKALSCYLVCARTQGWYPQGEH